MGKSTKLARVNAVAALGAKEKALLAKKGRAAIAVVVAMKREIKKSFYAMGPALVVLREPAIIRALGHPSFDELCTVELAMSDAQANRWIHIAESFSKREAEGLTSAKATAVIDLAHALGKDTTAKGLIKRGTVHLPNGSSIDVKAASAARIASAARTIRSGRPASGPGIHISPADRRLLDHVVAKLAQAKIKATVAGVAGGAKTGAKMRLTVGLRDLRKLGQALLHVE